MKKVIITIILSLGSLFVVAMASVGSGDIIKSDLINAILDIEVSTGENTFSAKISNNETSPGNGIGNVISQSHDYFEASCSLGTNNTICNLNQAKIDKLTIAPVCTFMPERAGITSSEIYAIGNLSYLQVEFITKNASGNRFGGHMNVICERQGSDRYPRRKIKDIILDLLPNIFN